MSVQAGGDLIGQRRGRCDVCAEQDAVWSLVALQDMFDEWIARTGTTARVTGCGTRLTPGAALTPNEPYAALLEVFGYMPAPLAAEDYLKLLPLTCRGVTEPSANLTAEAGIAVFKIAFECWIKETSQPDLPRLIRESLGELKAVTAGK